MFEGIMVTPSISHSELKQHARHFHLNGYAVLPAAFSPAQCEKLKSQALRLVEGIGSTGPRHRFTTDESRRVDDRYFLESGRDIRVFYEDNLAGFNHHERPNKLGHALHDKDPIFERFSRNPLFSMLATALGFKDPLLIQSMYIFKGSGGGGRVAWHQDSTFLHTEPMSAVGMWIALDDARKENGCLTVIPGGHRGPLRRRLIRDENEKTRFLELSDVPFRTHDATHLEVSRGSVILLHGLLPHGSEVNESDLPREAYTLHLIERDAIYSQDNWMYPDAGDPWRGF
jgi:phytanoyl-CoA hydroxylase